MTQQALKQPYSRQDCRQWVLDTFTDDLFSVDGVPKIIFPYSRAFCDVERFIEHEPMEEKFGQGFYYSNGINLKPFRSNRSKAIVLEKIYIPHH